MPERSVEDRLREEYFDLLPEIRRVTEHLDAEVRYRVLPISRNWQSFDRVTVRSRVKDCESPIDSLRKKQEGRSFGADQLEEYTLAGLKDLAGVRVLAFPRNRVEDVDLLLRNIEVLSDGHQIPFLATREQWLLVSIGATTLRQARGSSVNTKSSRC
jgi:ppGpp synthetase/RelA/SpoT-type nucleotidyltranferase